MRRIGATHRALCLRSQEAQLNVGLRKSLQEQLASIAGIRELGNEAEGAGAGDGARGRKRERKVDEDRISEFAALL